MTKATAKTNRPLIDLLDNELVGQGHELIDMMQAAAANSGSIDMTEIERCRIYLGSLLFAATVEGLNKGMDRYSVSQLDLLSSSWLMTGEAIASGVAQGFDISTPRGRKIVRNKVKEVVMQGYDHFMDTLLAARQS